MTGWFQQLFSSLLLKNVKNSRVNSFSKFLLYLDLEVVRRQRLPGGALCTDWFCCVRTLDLCGSSVSLEPVKAVLSKCPLLSSINLSSCRALPRGMKRLYHGLPLVQLRSSMLNPQTDH